MSGPPLSRPMFDGALSPAADGLRLAVRVTPRASRAAIQGPAPEADGGTVLKIAVTAPPEDGKANAAVIALLAKAWKLPKTSIRVIAGATDRRKVLAIAGQPDDLLRHIAARCERTAP